MKVLAINGSPQNRGTQALLQETIKGAKLVEGVSTEMINLNDYEIKQCTGCDSCINRKPCPLIDDMDKLCSKLKESDGIIIGSPSYFLDVSGLLKVFFDRTRPCKMSGWELKDKVISAVVTSGLIHGGGESVIQTINNFGLAHGMIVVGAVSSPVLDPVYPIATLQKERKQFRKVTEDEFAFKIAKEIGVRVGTLVRQLNK